MEGSGHTIEELRGSDTAVYTGTMSVDWMDQNVRDFDTMPQYFATGSNRAIISNRVSYVFDWRGPSMTIDTACSSSLIAVHQGVMALRSRESRVAVACGTQVILNPEQFIAESKLQMLSPTGRSRMWDKDADGYARYVRFLSFLSPIRKLSSVPETSLLQRPTSMKSYYFESFEMTEDCSLVFFH